MPHSGTSLSRSGWTLTILAGGSVWLAGPHASAAITAITGTDFPHALLGIASLVQLTIALWVILVVGLTQLIGPAAALRATTPRVLRGALLAGTAGAVAIAPAHADQGAAPSQDHAAVSATRHNLAGLPFPDRPITVSLRSDTTVIVQPGDTLWTIARRSLPHGASDEEIALPCHRWFAANRAVIGGNPDLILPAQRLHPPTKDHS